MTTWADTCDLEAAGFSPVLARRIRRAQPHVMAAAARHRMPPALVNGVIAVESNFNPNIVSRAGAQGLMQIMPKTLTTLQHTANEFDSPFDPAHNVNMGTMFLAQLFRSFANHRHAIAAYNAGAGGVRKALAQGIEDPRSSYVNAVLREHSRYINLMERCENLPPIVVEPEPEPDFPILPTPPTRQPFPIPFPVPADPRAQSRAPEPEPSSGFGLLGLVGLVVVVGLVAAGGSRREAA